MLYQENGHVTDPALTPRPPRGGTVYVYWTFYHEDSDGINDIFHAWSADGKGGNGKGQLLVVQFYDDGICYQSRGGPQVASHLPIYVERVEKYGLDEIMCQIDFQFPEDLSSNGTYTVMWVWDWPLITSDSTNVTEIYTSCAEIQLRIPAGRTGSEIHFAANHNVQNAGIQSRVENPFDTTPR